MKGKLSPMLQLPCKQSCSDWYHWCLFISLWYQPTVNALIKLHTLNSPTICCLLGLNGSLPVACPRANVLRSSIIISFLCLQLVVRTLPWGVVFKVYHGLSPDHVMNHMIMQWITENHNRYSTWHQIFLFIYQREVIVFNENIVNFAIKLVQQNVTNLVI